MVAGEDLQARAGEIWPPAVEYPAAVPAIAPNVRWRELRLGRAALLSALAGIGLDALATGTAFVTDRTGWWLSAPTVERDHLALAVWTVYLIGAICGVMAVITGIIARRTRTGRWGLAVSLPVLAFSVALISSSFSYHVNGAWPWQGHSDDGSDCCHEKMR